VDGLENKAIEPPALFPLYVFLIAYEIEQQLVESLVFPCSNFNIAERSLDQMSRALQCLLKYVITHEFKLCYYFMLFSLVLRRIHADSFHQQFRLAQHVAVMIHAMPDKEFVAA